MKRSRVTLSTITNVRDGFDDVAVMEFPYSQVDAHLSDCYRSYYRCMSLVLVYYFRNGEFASKWKDEMARYVPSSPFVLGRLGTDRRVSREETYRTIWKSYEEDGPAELYDATVSRAKVMANDELSAVYAPGLRWDLVREDPEACLAFMSDFHNAVAGILHDRGSATTTKIRGIIDDLLEKYPLRRNVAK